MAQEILKSIPTLKEFDDEKGVIRGYANVYNVKDSDGDISLFGSFTKTVTERGKEDTNLQKPRYGAGWRTHRI